jgi:glycerol-3-phosphate acyltransferase PlsY
MNTVINSALILGAYLLGSFPYMMLLSRAKGYNFSREADLHLTMLRKVGFLEAVSGIAVDVLKGIVPILVGFYLDFAPSIIAAAGIAVLVGQMWPVFNRFDGEKGNTTGFGIVIALSAVYSAALIILTGAVIVLIGFSVRTIPRFTKSGQTTKERLKFDGPPSNSLPVAMLIAFAGMPLVAWLIGVPLHVLMLLIAVFLLIVLRRLTAGLYIDIRTPRTGITRILIMRFLLDRSYF